MIYVSDYLSEFHERLVDSINDMGDGEVMLTFAYDRLEKFCGSLDGLGWKLVESCNVGETYGTFYEHDNGNTMYVYTNSLVPFARAVLGAKFAADDKEREAVYCETLFHQVYSSPKIRGSSMTYLIRLKDGRFIIIDGGFNIDGEGLISLMEQLHPKKSEDETFDIAAWIMTHPHCDHINLFKKILPDENIMSRLSIRRLIANCPATAELFGVDEDVIPDNDYVRTVVFEKLAANGCEIVKPYAGMNFRIGEIKLNVFYTQAEWHSTRMQTINDASVMFSLERDGGKTVMILGDVMNNAAQFIMRMYSDKSLRCDAVQISHHALAGPVIEFYELMKPKICFWPQDLNGYGYNYTDEQPLIAQFNKVLREMDLINCIACFGPSQIMI